MAESDLPRAVGVAANQPSNASRFRRQSPWALGVFAVAFAILGVWAAGRRCDCTGDMTVAPAQYQGEFLTAPFTVHEAGALCKAVFEADVDNSWVYLDVAVVNAEEEVVLDFSSQMSYYHGSDSDGSWSEGSRKDAAVFKLAKPGAYRFLVTGQAGTGNAAGDTLRAGRPVRIRVFEGVVLARYFLVAACLCAALVALEIFRRAKFEAARWADVTDDDDDDDDW